LKPAPVADNLEQDLKTSPEWRARLSTWGIYAAAGGATLAMASNADASTIIYGVANVSASVAPGALSDFASKGFQIGGHSVKIAIGELRTSNTFSVFAAIRGPLTSGLFFADRGRGSLINFNPGQSILTAAGFAAPYGLARAIVSFSGVGPASFGKFESGKTGFAGFYLLNGSSQLDFGWLRIKVSDPNSVGYMTEIQALDWAYNDASLAPIAAAEGPEPGTAALALLASGAAGLLAWRRRRKA
jgi:hypothetical protein